MAVMAALSLLCHREGWDNLKASYADLLKARVREKDSGLLKMDGIGEPKLARLAIIFVPNTMLTHWVRTAQSAVFGVKETFGAHTDVLVWRGLHREHSVRDAYQSGKPVLWILPMESDSIKAIRTTPEIGYAVCIFDELNAKMKTRYDQPESTALFYYIVRAYALKHACDTQMHEISHLNPLCPRRPRLRSNRFRVPRRATRATRCAWPLGTTTNR